MFVVMLALHSAYGNVRNTNVGMSERMTRRIAFAKLTLIRSIVNLSWPFSSVLDTRRGIYLEAAVAEWNGAERGGRDDANAAAPWFIDAADAADIFFRWITIMERFILYCYKQLVYNQFYSMEPR